MTVNDDDGMIDPTITGCLMNPLKNTPHGPRNLEIFNFTRSITGEFAREEDGINYAQSLFSRATSLANVTLLCNLVKQKFEVENSFAILSARQQWRKGVDMAKYSSGTTAVIFVAQRTTLDDDGYAQAATAMTELAAKQPGYCGIDSVRDVDGLGITVSYWSDDTAAKSWRDNEDHARIRDAGRDRWYQSYSLHVASITRSYDWTKIP